MTQACWTQYEILKILLTHLGKDFIFTYCVDNFLPQTLKMSAQLFENFYPTLPYSQECPLATVHYFGLRKIDFLLALYAISYCQTLCPLPWISL